LRQLFHVAPSIQDENERKRFIAEMNAALAKRLGPKQRLKSVKAAGNAKSITR
jgi:hypothetical protein